jgi:alpha-D-ribose 1-methylphosphonate 5-triphosphate synthase subunit PhnH
MSSEIAHLKESRFDFVHDSQKAFRTIMAAISSPGSILSLPPIPLCLSRPDLAFILQPLLTLLDLETTFFVAAGDPTVREEVIRYLAINTGSRACDCDQADFILCLDSSLGGRFGSLKKGSLEAPHKSATVYYLVDRLITGSRSGSIGLTLRGPGIKERRTVFVTGLSAQETTDWENHRSRFPAGVDIFLVSRTGEITGMPRSTIIEN